MGNEHVERPWLKNYDKHVPPKLKYEEKCFTGLFFEGRCLVLI
ncbi:MAG: hypothetical protein STSR0003_18810 [Smithella sp.]|jgi:hypothetical protein|nr:hypothetical protein [Smithellaceae bacterium]